MSNTLDDDFGGFEDANASITNNANLNVQETTVLPDWLLKPFSNSTVTSLSSQNTNKDLENELNKAREQIKQQNDFIQFQLNHQKNLEDRINLMNASFLTAMNAFKELKENVNQKLFLQKELCNNEFRDILNIHSAEQEQKLINQIKAIDLKYKREFNEKLESKLVEFQEKLIKYTESQYEDIEMKIKNMFTGMIKEENLKFKQNVDLIEKNLKNDVDKHAQNFFKGQNEFLKEQIKSATLQEHLIQRDLVNKKLDRIFRTSEEKRRQVNLAFTRHMSGLNFFIDNAHKQLSVLKEAHKDLFKNKELSDEFILDLNNNNNNISSSSNPPLKASDLENQFQSEMTYVSSLEREFSGLKTNQRSTELDEDLIDENLLQ